MTPNIWLPSALSPTWTEAGPGAAGALRTTNPPSRHFGKTLSTGQKSFMTAYAVPNSAPLAITRRPKLIALRTAGRSEMKVDDFPSTDRTWDFVLTLWDQHPVLSWRLNLSSSCQKIIDRALFSCKKLTALPRANGLHEE